jgi:plasmid stabilization system protein ParE
MPLIGRPYRRSPVAGTRRVRLERSHYHIYYLAGSDDVRILAVWHARRGAGPPLRK